MSGRARERTTSSWPWRLAVATALAAVPLVLFGGSVTTLGAGMAVEGWLVAEGHFLLFFPVQEWFRDTATFVEHTHRLFGVLVGLCAIATVVATWDRDPRRSARLAALGGLLAVSLQGVLGGFRVLEASPRLAFLHGALAQAVFALLCVVALVLAPAWRTSRAERAPLGRGTRTLALLAPLFVYAQIVVGALYRHALRPQPAAEAGGLLLLHAGGAVVVAVWVATLAGLVARARAGGRGLRLALLLAAQIVLGLVAWIGHRPGALGPLEWGVSIAHVLGGALLLAETSVLALWAWRRTRSAEPTHGAAELGMGTAR